MVKAPVLSSLNLTLSQVHLSTLNIASAHGQKVQLYKIKLNGPLSISFLKPQSHTCQAPMLAFTCYIRLVFLEQFLSLGTFDLAMENS